MVLFGVPYSFLCRGLQLRGPFPERNAAAAAWSVPSRDASPVPWPSGPASGGVPTSRGSPSLIPGLLRSLLVFSLAVHSVETPWGRFRVLTLSPTTCGESAHPGDQPPGLSGAPVARLSLSAQHLNAKPEL